MSSTTWYNIQEILEETRFCNLLYLFSNKLNIKAFNNNKVIYKIKVRRIIKTKVGKIFMNIQFSKRLKKAKF